MASIRSLVVVVVRMEELAATDTESSLSPAIDFNPASASFDFREWVDGALTLDLFEIWLAAFEA